MSISGMKEGEGCPGILRSCSTAVSGGADTSEAGAKAIQQKPNCLDITSSPHLAGTDALRLTSSELGTPHVGLEGPHPLS